MDDSDLAGPVLFFVLFGTFLLVVSTRGWLAGRLANEQPEEDARSWRSSLTRRQSGNVHFGYIYGLALLGSTSLHVILSLMAPPLAPSDVPAPPDHHSRPSHFSSTLTFARSASVLGYCLLPLVFTSLIGILMPMDTLFGYLITTAAILWCTYSSSAMFCAVGRMTGMRGLVAYPLALFYVCFGIMALFSSKGTGTVVKVAVGPKA